MAEEINSSSKESHRTLCSKCSTGAFLPNNGSTLASLFERFVPTAKNADEEELFSLR